MVSLLYLLSIIALVTGTAAVYMALIKLFPVQWLYYHYFIRKPIVWVILVGTGLTGLWIGIFPLLAVSFPMAIFGFVLLNFFGGITMGSYNAFVAEVEQEAKGTTISINNTFGQISQAIAVAIISRLIYARTKNYSYSGFVAMGFYAITVILMIFFVKPKKKVIKVSANEQHKVK